MLIPIIFGVYGLIIGSFLNALIWRLHEQTEAPTGRGGESLSVWRGRSVCPNCRHQLRWYDLIPVVSWLALKAKCRDCHKPISIHYPLVELTTGVVFGLSAALLQSNGWAAWMQLAAWLWVAASLIALSLYDLRWYLLPDRILLPALLPAAASVLTLAASSGNLAVLWHHLAAALVASGVFYAITAISGGRWMGGGDVKLLFLIGLLLGPTHTVVALFIAFDTAAIVGLGLILAGKKSRKDYLPFGPFLAFGTVVAMLWGSAIIGYYLSLAGIAH